MLKKNNGFTLIELVVSMAIAGTILLALTSISTLAARFNVGANDMGQAQTMAVMYLQTIEGQLRFAESVNIETSLPDTLKENYHYIYLSDGFIKKQAQDYTEDFLTPLIGFEDFTCSIDFSAVNSKVAQANLSISKNNKPLYSISSKIFVNNLIEESITGVTQGVCISYKLSGVSVSAIVVQSQSSTINTDGETLQMTAVVYPENAENKGVAWSVDNPETAQISQEGLLTPQKSGIVEVKATALDGSGVEGSKQITINLPQKIPITALTLNTNTKGDKMNVGSVITIIPSITPSDATNKLLTWIVSDANLATIDDNGILKALDKGKVVVTAFANDGSTFTDKGATIEIHIQNN